MPVSDNDHAVARNFVSIWEFFNNPCSDYGAEMDGCSRGVYSIENI